VAGKSQDIALDEGKAHPRSGASRNDEWPTRMAATDYREAISSNHRFLATATGRLACGGHPHRRSETARTGPKSHETVGFS